MTDEQKVNKLMKNGYVVQYVNPNGQTFIQKYRVYKDKKLVCVNNDGEVEKEIK